MGGSWALVGGLAVGSRAEPRITRDVDLAGALASDREAKAIVFRLQALGYTVLDVREQEATDCLATIRLHPMGEGEGGVIVDLLFASSGIETEITRAAEVLEIVPGLRAPVATLGHLMAFKVLVRDGRQRTQDFDDLRALLVEAEPRDLGEARAALRLLEQRAYERSRELLPELEKIN